MGDRVMAHLKLDPTWKSRIIAVLRSDEPPQEDQGQEERLGRALENLRKQHQWGDISDDEYRRERDILMRQLKVHSTAVKPTHLPNLERAANFLEDLLALWLHPGVTHEEREALVQQVFRRIAIDGKEFVDIEPKPEYAPLFATMVTEQKVGYQELESPPSPPRTQRFCPGSVDVSFIRTMSLLAVALSFTHRWCTFLKPIRKLRGRSWTGPR